MAHVCHSHALEDVLAGITHQSLADMAQSLQAQDEDDDRFDRVMEHNPAYHIAYYRCDICRYSYAERTLKRGVENHIREASVALRAAVMTADETACAGIASSRSRTTFTSRGSSIGKAIVAAAVFAFDTGELPVCVSSPRPLQSVASLDYATHRFAASSAL